MKATKATKATIIGLTLMALGACSEQTGKTTPEEVVSKVAVKQEALVIENNSPDNAVKSWWKIRDWMKKGEEELCNQTSEGRKKLNADYYQHASKTLTGGVLEFVKQRNYDCTADVYSREITEVKTESETRAVVFARIKDISPIPQGAVITTDDKEAREKGTQFKYVLEKDSTGWKIVKTYIQDYLSQRFNDTLKWEESMQVKPPSVNTFIFLD